MELRHLRYFKAVVESGSLTEAAERILHTSQPSLSRQIRDLEAEVGVQLLTRGARGVEPTAAGRAFYDHARTALTQVDAAVEAARRAALPLKQHFALGFLSGMEMLWLPEVMHVLRDQLPAVDVTVSSDYSPALADRITRGRLDIAFLRAEPNVDVVYRIIGREPLVVLMPHDHPLTAHAAIDPKQLANEPFIEMAAKASILRAVVDHYLLKVGVQVTPLQAVDNPAMVMSLVASTRAVTLIPAYVQSLLPPTVVSRPLSGEVPTIELAIGHARTNQSPILELFLSRLDELISRVSTRAQLVTGSQ